MVICNSKNLSKTFCQQAHEIQYPWLILPVHLLNYMLVMLPSDTNLSPFFPSFPCEGPQPHPRGFPVTLVLDEGQLVLDFWGGQRFLLLINHVHAKEPTPVQHNCMNGCHSLWFCEWNYLLSKVDPGPSHCPPTYPLSFLNFFFFFWGGGGVLIFYLLN